MQNCIAYESTLLDHFFIDRAELPSKERERAREIQEVVWSQKSLNNFTI